MAAVENINNSQMAKMGKEQQQVLKNGEHAKAFVAAFTKVAKEIHQVPNPERKPKQEEHKKRGRNLKKEDYEKKDEIDEILEEIDKRLEKLMKMAEEIDSK